MAASQNRVVLLVDLDHVEVLEAPKGLRIETIDWDKIANDVHIANDAVLALDEALKMGNVDEALYIYKGLTQEDPRDEGEDPRAIDPSWGTS